MSYCSNDHLGPIIKKLSVPEALIVSLFHSSVLPCLEVGGGRVDCGGGVGGNCLGHLVGGRMALLVCSSLAVITPSFNFGPSKPVRDY